MRKLFTIIFCLFMIVGARAQDIHFSQYFLSPLTLNPAMTGFFDGDYRVIANYRNQWSRIYPGLYRTASASVDASFLKTRLETDYLGAGIVAYQDWAGSAGFNTTQVGGSIAYSKGIGFQVKHAIKIGFTGMYTQQSIDLTSPDLIFSGGVPENFSDNTSQFDVAAGLLYHTKPKERLNMYVGASVHHILMPSISFFGDNDVTISPKITAHALALIELGNNFNLIPSIMYMMQADAMQINTGGYVQFILGDQFESETFFAIGAWTRISRPVPDAVIAGARFDYKSFTAAMSYDVNISEFSGATNGRGAFEVALIYVGNLGPGRYKGLDCPNF
ncbi:MAG: PorP/SprF family type IX secretion system membrane protein [Bacteroidia bacterium]|nr:PorP/SprF family type IX secretion system membrane protein [Bacteroidia bacterium]